jgi:tetratricopeptide (TPR) repeat protein
MVMELTGNYARALDLYTEGLGIAKRIDDRWYAALGFTLQTGLVGITQSLVKLEVTYARFQAAVTDWRSIGDPRFIAIGLNNLSLCALWLGLFDEARSALEESVELCSSIGERWGLSYAYRGLGNIAQAQGDHQQALDLFRKSLDTLIELGARQDIARVKAEMSRSIFALGNDAETWRTLCESLRIAIETKGWFIVMEALTGLAGLQAKRGDLKSAYELVLVVLYHPFAIPDARDRAAHLRNELEALLSSQQIEAIQARVQSKTIEDSLNEILNFDQMV